MNVHLFRVRLEVENDLEFEGLPGPVLRGALLEAMRMASCDRADRPGECSCPKGCLFGQLFKPTRRMPRYRHLPGRFRDLPPPIVLRPHFGAGTYSSGSILELDVALPGSTVRDLPWIVAAVARAGIEGVGRRGVRTGRFHLRTVHAIGPGGGTVPLFDDASGTLRAAEFPWVFPSDFGGPVRDPQWPPAVSGSPALIELVLLTPTALERGAGQRPQFHFGLLVESFLRRVWLLGQMTRTETLVGREDEISLVRIAVGVPEVDRALAWNRTSHRSGRQRRAIDLSGWTGRVVIEGDPDLWIPLLRLAGALNIGRHTLYGCGQVEARMMPVS